MWAGWGGREGLREFYVPQNANCALYDRGSVRLEREGSVIVYAITTFGAQAKLLVLFMQQAADTYSTFVALGYTLADYGSYGNHLVGKIKQVEARRMSGKS